MISETIDESLAVCIGNILPIDLDPGRAFWFLHFGCLLARLWAGGLASFLVGFRLVSNSVSFRIRIGFGFGFRPTIGRIMLTIAVHWAGISWSFLSKSLIVVN